MTPVKVNHFNSDVDRSEIEAFFASHIDDVNRFPLLPRATDPLKGYPSYIHAVLDETGLIGALHAGAAAEQTPAPTATAPCDGEARLPGGAFIDLEQDPCPAHLLVRVGPGPGDYEQKRPFLVTQFQSAGLRTGHGLPFPAGRITKNPPPNAYHK